MSEKRPPLEFSTGSYTVKWTYGLQMDIQRLLPDTSQLISMLTSDIYLRDFVIRRALTPLKGSITEEKDLIAAEDIELDPEQLLDLLDFVSSHLNYFFTMSARKAAQIGADYQNELGHLTQSATGSES
jgi:hypothetical protein